MAAGQVTLEAPAEPQIAPDTRARAWAFTVMNYTPVCVQLVVEMINSARYGICGYEVCPSTGTPHLQGFIYWDSAKEFQIMRKFVPRARFSVKYPRATHDHNRVYCAKEGQLLIEVGSPPRPGERTDIQETYRILRMGGGMRDITGAQLGHQCIRVAETWLKYHEPPRSVKPEIIWIHGPPGSGKTWGGYEILGTEDVYVAPRTTSKFWDGYDGQANVLIDDIRKDWCKFVELLGITDRYAYQVEVKGSSRQFRATKIVITSPYTPEELFRDVGENIKQLTGRITEILSMEGSTHSRPEPVRRPFSDFLSERKVKDATRGEEGRETRPVQEEAQTGGNPGGRFKDIKRENNLGVLINEHGDGNDVDLRCASSSSSTSQSQECTYPRVCHDYADPYPTTSWYSGQGIYFPQEQSLCSSGSNQSDGSSFSDSESRSQDDSGGEDDDAYTCELREVSLPLERC